MINRQFERQKKQLSDYFRRFGLEGEFAFHALAYQYVLRYPDRLASLSQPIVQRWQSAYQKIEKDLYIISFLGELANQDALGDKLPEWYQFFIGRRYREGSGKFFTPKPIAQAMARLLPKRRSPIIMDSTCGGGTFLVEASRIWHDEACTLVANDIEYSLVELTMVTLGLAAPPYHEKHFIAVNIFDPTPELTKWHGQVDYILANPPFSLKIEHEQFDSRLFSSGYRNSDALFIDTALKLLKPGGRLVCLLPHSIIANSEFSHLRTIAEKSWIVLGVICLPEGVFHLSAGTTTRADIVVLEKKPAQNNKLRKLFFASVPSVGIPLNNVAKNPVANDLEKITHTLEAQEALGI